MRSFATYTRSGSATTETTEVSLMRKMTLAASGGTEVATACGRATWRSVWVRVRPSADADSH